MTTYESVKLNRREIGSGCETDAYAAWGNKRQVTLFTTNEYKWYWLNFLGLVRSEQKLVYVQYPPSKWGNYPAAKSPKWRFNVVKLQCADYDSPQFKAAWQEWCRFNYENIPSNKPEDFNVIRPVIEFCLLTGVTYANTDSNWFNFLQHPRTKRVYPYDVFVPKHNTDISKLR